MTICIKHLLSIVTVLTKKINLVGLSLGGVLAIDYITEFPEKINSIILVGTPYKIPKTIRVQII